MPMSVMPLEDYLRMFPPSERSKRERLYFKVIRLNPLFFCENIF
jgi:hypothetical protein